VAHEPRHHDPHEQPSPGHGDRSGTPHAEVPVAIVGAGACGLVAAIALRDAGIDCVLLERDAQPQGSTALSSGFIPAAGTRCSARGHHRRQPGPLPPTSRPRPMARRAAPGRGLHRGHRPAHRTCRQRHGLPSSCWTAFCTPATACAACTPLPQRTGAALMAALRAATASRRRDADAGAGARAVVRRDGGPRHSASATSARRPHRARWPATCCCWPATALAATRDLVREVAARDGDATFAGHTGNDGSAIAWGRRWARGWPTWAATRATARGRCRRAR
jgi:fumarate reductase flavoprotein subunit